MYKKNLTLIFLFFAFNVSAQNVGTDKTDSLAQVIQNCLEKARRIAAENKRQNRQIETLDAKLNEASAKIEELQTALLQNRTAIDKTEQTLGGKIAETEQIAASQIAEMDKSLGKTTLWVIVGLSFALVVSGIVYLLLRRKQQSDKTNIVAQLSQTKQAIDEKLVNEFAKNTEALEMLLSKMSGSTQSTEPDHSLALKVASEINLMERNINLMDAKTRGLKQLTRSVENLKDNLAANGYEIPQLLNKDFNQGMRIIVASSVPDENLEKGVEKITKILIPQVNYNGVMIQTAQIEVSVGF